MRHDMVSCGQVEKIKRNGLTLKDRVASVKGKSKARVRWTMCGSEARARTWCRWNGCNGEEQVKLRSRNQ